jgi:hypothetical protein
VNGNKENSRIVKTYVCRCGEVNRFSFETDFNFMEVRIDAHCQGCGKEISISVEKHFGNGNDSSYPQNGYQNQNNNYSNGYGNGYNQPSYQAPSYPSPSSILEPQSSVPSPSSEPQSSPSSGMMDFNFDALTSAAESMSSTPTSSPAPEPVAAVQDYTNYASPTAPSPPIEVAEALNSLSPDIMQDAESEVPEISEPAPLPLATTVIQTPAKKIIQEVEKEEEKDLLSCSNEVEEMNKDVTPDDQEAFIDLFGRL